MNDIFEDGKDAFECHEDLEDNPYSYSTERDKYLTWLDGWKEAEAAYYEYIHG